MMDRMEIPRNEAWRLAVLNRTTFQNSQRAPKPLLRSTFVEVAVRWVHTSVTLSFHGMLEQVHVGLSLVFPREDFSF